MDFIVSSSTALRRPGDGANGAHPERCGCVHARVPCSGSLRGQSGHGPADLDQHNQLQNTQNSNYEWLRKRGQVRSELIVLGYISGWVIRSRRSDDRLPISSRASKRVSSR